MGAVKAQFGRALRPADFGEYACGRATPATARAAKNSGAKYAQPLPVLEKEFL